MKYREYRIPAPNVRSLCWNNNSLIDWVAGGTRYQLDGKIKRSATVYPYPFDAAVQSASGEVVVIYQRLGTKGLVLKNGKIVREINRSYYYADSYEYPIAVLQHADLNDVLLHCPDKHNQLDLEDVATGRRLTEGWKRKPVDIFHSRLSVSPKGTWAVSAGWQWQPAHTVAIYKVDELWSEPQILDTEGFCPPIKVDISSVSFLDEQTLLIITDEFANLNANLVDTLVQRRGAHSIGYYDLENRQFRATVQAQEIVGTAMALSERYVVGFFDHPKVFDCTTGKVVQRWPELATGRQTHSMIGRLDQALPPTAFDSANQRFAVADEKGITVIELDLQDIN
ncbi:hypothetical protein [Herpetosiphon sp. NSE202]|uniref:hypothetical protein n=1 Tax=Herpetosiphon sp. NSE202 TaxID=3351349 RepID=UPI00362FC88F